MTRIVSLLPAATEIVCALGQGDALVGRSHECDFPPAVARLPALSEPRLDPHRPAAAIHASVEALLAATLGVYRIDPVRLRDLAPTHVVTQVRCDVCAVSLEDVEAALDHWTSGRPKLVALNAGSLEDALFDIERVGLALGAQDEADLLVAALRDRMAAISARALRTTSRPRVAAIEWLAPAMGAGNWIPELVDLAGGVNLFGRKGRHSPILSLAEIAASDPDVVVCFPCGFSLERVRREAPGVLRPAGARASSTRCARAGSTSPTATSSSTARGRGWSSRSRSWPSASTPRPSPSVTRASASSASAAPDPGSANPLERAPGRGVARVEPHRLAPGGDRLVPAPERRERETEVVAHLGVPRGRARPRAGTRPAPRRWRPCW